MRYTSGAQRPRYAGWLGVLVVIAWITLLALAVVDSIGNFLLRYF